VLKRYVRGSSSYGRAFDSHSKGDGFDSRVLQFLSKNLRNRSLELKKNLHEYLLDIYYSIELSWFPDKKGKDGKIKKDSRDLKDLVKLMKEITVWIVRKYPKDTKIDTYVSDDEEDS
jgi:hypothetical protein